MEKIIKKICPLTESTLYTLIALIEPLHGYGIIKKVEVLTNNRLTLAPGTLYGVLSSLQTNKLIILQSEEKERKKKKVYKITPLGLDILDYERIRLSELVNNLTKGMINHG